MAGYGMLEPAKFIVAIDFGTSHSGFAYAHAHAAENDPDNFLDTVSVYDRWPSQARAGARPYFKTQTSLLYMQESSCSDDTFKLKEWGWSAFCEYRSLLQKSGNSNQLGGKRFHFLKNFKLALAGADSYDNTYTLPKGLKAERVIADYLHELLIVIEGELQAKYGKHITAKDIQWCLTVPATWNEVAKQQMKKCAERAGLVSGPSNKHGEASPHQIIIVLEPEAASAYCLHHLNKTRTTVLAAQSKYLVVDAGGGTVDLVLHEKMNSKANCNQVKEICSGSSGALCGSTFVDDAFYKLFSRKISCYDEFIVDNPAAALRIHKQWEELKVCFDGEVFPEFWLPGKLSTFWEAYNQSNGVSHPESGYDELQITVDDMRAVFDNSVDTILRLIEQQLGQVESNDVDALLVVGGFSGSPYLMTRIKQEFHGKVQHIINPTHAGKAVMVGAIAYGSLGQGIVTARISQKTYGIAKFNEKADSGNTCDLIFDVFVRKGEEVAVEHCVKRWYTALDWRESVEDCIVIQVFSTTETHPSYVTDPGSIKECSTYRFPYPAMSQKPVIEVSMFFGRSIIELTAVPTNFGGRAVILPWISFDAAESAPLESQL